MKQIMKARLLLTLLVTQRMMVVAAIPKFERRATNNRREPAVSNACPLAPDDHVFP